MLNTIKDQVIKQKLIENENLITKTRFNKESIKDMIEDMIENHILLHDEFLKFELRNRNFKELDEFLLQNYNLLQFISHKLKELNTK